MREIKFRIWDGESNSYAKDGWTYGWQIYANRNIQGPDPLGEIFEQFTGLLDKNSKEIYEGDIVSVTDVYGKKHNSIVAFNDGCFDVEGNSEPFHGRDYLKCSVVNHACVVIGNIHENPELLTGND